MKQKGLFNESKFIFQVYNSDLFQNQYSEYFLSSLKDQLSFYYSDDDFKLFIKFFDYFSEPQFSFEDYHKAYDKFVDEILDNKQIKDIPKFFEDPKEFLQLLYDSNIITAIENCGEYFHFSYREKSISNIAPEVPFNNNISYRFHYGLYKKTKLGRFS